MSPWERFTATSRITGRSDKADLQSGDKGDAELIEGCGRCHAPRGVSSPRPLRPDPPSVTVTPQLLWEQLARRPHSLGHSSICRHGPAAAGVRTHDPGCRAGPEGPVPAGGHQLWGAGRALRLQGMPRRAGERCWVVAP